MLGLFVVIDLGASNGHNLNEIITSGFDKRFVRFVAEEGDGGSKEAAELKGARCWERLGERGT